MEVVGFIWPPRCWLCGAGIEGLVRRDPWCTEHQLTDRSGGATCVRCAADLPPGMGPRSVCAGCRRRAPAFAQVAAPLAYRDPAARAAILAFKHGGRRDLCAPLARALSAGLSEGPSPFDLLVPVPSHPSRILARGYDPPALLAAELELAGLGQRASVLRRVRATPPQGSPGAPARHGNVRGAFRSVARLGGEAVWLVDDVVASGATADACARTLREAGAGRVEVLALARA